MKKINWIILVTLAAFDLLFYNQQAGVNFLLVSFLLVGASTAVLQLATLAFLLELAGADYKIAAALAFIMSVIFHFVANRYFTFGMVGSPRMDQIVRYLIIVIINLSLTIGITTLSVEVFRWNAYVGTALSILSTVLIGYVGSKRWVFINKEISHG